MKVNGISAAAAFCLAIATPMLIPDSSSGAMLASDDGSSSAYSSGAFVGYNGGTGFQAWQGTSDNYIANSGSSGISSTILVNGKAFAVWGGGSSGSTTDGVYRSFLNDSGGTSNVALDVGQSISLDMDQRTAALAGPKGISLGSSSAIMFTFDMVNANSDYQIIDGSGTKNTTFLGETTDPILMTFTLTSSTTYSFSVEDLATSSPQATYTTTGTLANAGSISQINIFQNGPSNNDLYFNSLAITPEPASAGLLCLGSLGLLARRRRRSGTGA